MGGRQVCIANQRPSVGKTATAVNLAVSFATAGQSTLLVDLDPSCRATRAVGAREADRHPLVLGQPLSGLVQDLGEGRPDLLAGCCHPGDLAELHGQESAGDSEWPDRFAWAGAAYDWIVFDCPSSAGRLTEIGLMSSLEVLVPISCEYFALDGVTQLVQVIKSAMERHPRRLEFGGILLTMHEDSLELAREVDKEVRDFFGEIVFETVIPRDRTVSLAANRSLSVVEHSPRARASRAYVELCKEVQERE